MVEALLGLRRLQALLGLRLPVLNRSTFRLH
jgi:hypothetical protein